MYRYSILALFTLIVLVPAVSFANTQVSNDFVLKDASGRKTAQLTTSAEGTPALFFYDKNGTIRISIGLYADGVPGVVLNDDTGKAGALMRLVQNGGDPVVVLKENGQDKLVITEDGIQGKSADASTDNDLMVGLLAGLLGGVVGGLIMRYRMGTRPV